MSTLLYPPFLQWEIVSECNHRCIHCYNYWRANNIAVDECDEYIKIAEKIVERKPLYVAITGGEPFLVFHKVSESIKKFVKAGIGVSVSTNGTLITDKYAKFLAGYKVDLVVSFPSCDEEVCDKVCCSKGVVRRLDKTWEILKKYGINVTVNIVVNKVNLSTLYDTLRKVNDLGFVARVGIAQRPINASNEYAKYELDEKDFENVVRICLMVKRQLAMDIDFSVCLPDCSFNDIDALDDLGKGNCFGGTLAYAVCTNGDIKACQCDTNTYGNILVDSFEEIYDRMSSWRDGTMIPDECRVCCRVDSCRGGCRVEAFASHGNYRKLPKFAVPQNVISYDNGNCSVKKYEDSDYFVVADNVKFLNDKECCRVSVGIVPTFLSFEFAKWIDDHRYFHFKDLFGACEIDRNDLGVVLNVLCKNGILNLRE